MTRRDIIEAKVVRIAKLSERELTIEKNSNGWLLAEGCDTGGISDTTFGARRRPYGQFVDFLDAILIGLTL